MSFIICERCGGTGQIDDGFTADRIERAVQLLKRDSRRDIYETTTSGIFAVSYLAGNAPVHLKRSDCEELVRRKIVFQDPDCAGWYHQMGYVRPSKIKPIPKSPEP